MHIDAGFGEVYSGKCKDMFTNPWSMLWSLLCPPETFVRIGQNTSKTL